MVVFNIQICRDRAFICENTGSRKGHREWFFGNKTSPWYSESELERFMAAECPDELEYRWTNYSGAGSNLFGCSTGSAHGSPGPIILLHPKLLDAHVRSLGVPEKKALYLLLASGDADRIGREIDGIVASAGGRE